MENDFQKGEIVIYTSEDGSYTLKFKASGSKEIMWHVFKWGSGCKIVKPATLNKEYKKYLNEVLSNQ